MLHATSLQRGVRDSTKARPQLVELVCVRLANFRQSESVRSLAIRSSRSIVCFFARKAWSSRNMWIW